MDEGNDHADLFSDDGFVESLASRRPSSPPATSSFRPWAVVGLVIGVFAIVFGTIIALRHPVVVSPTYDARTRSAFLDACAADGGSSTRPVCECAYEAISAKMPYDRFRELDAAALARRAAPPDDAVWPTAGATASTGPPGTADGTTSTSSPLPNDVQAVFSTCVSRQIIATPPTTATPTTTTSTSTGTTSPAPATTGQATISIS